MDTVATDRMARWREFKSRIATPDLPDLGPKVRDGRRSRAELERIVGDFNAGSAMHPHSLDMLLAAAFLWHDYLDASHDIVQARSGADASFIHGIMHRREPDYGNSKYWFHRVGRHATFPCLAKWVGQLLKEKGDSQLCSRLIPEGRWDPFAFVDACEETAGRRAFTEHGTRLQLVQELEFDALLAQLLS